MKVEDFVDNVLKQVVLSERQTAIQDEDDGRFACTDGTIVACNDEGIICRKGMDKIFEYRTGSEIDVSDAIEFFSNSFEIPEEVFVDRLKSLGEVAGIALDEYHRAKNVFKSFK